MAQADYHNIKISVTIDGLNIPQILSTTGLCAALLLCDPRTHRPFSLRRNGAKPVVGTTEVFTKPNATNNPLGILVKFKDPIPAHFAFERRTYVALALFAGEVMSGETEEPIGVTPPFFLAELLLARRHTRNTEIKWVVDPAPMNPSSKVKVMLVASEVSGGGVDFIQFEFRGEKMKKMDFLSESDCYFRLRRVYPSAAETPPAVLARAKAAKAVSYASKYKGKANAEKFNPNEILSEVYQSPTIDNCANPVWPLTNAIMVSSLTGPDHSAPCIEFACFDEDRFPRSDEEMGMFRVSLSDLIFAAKDTTGATSFKVTAYSKSTAGKIKDFGTIYCTRAEVTRRPSCLALLSDGWRMRLTVAVDFSSADKDSPSNLHYNGDPTNPRKNVTARIVAGVGDIMSVYGASTQSTPSLGLAGNRGSSNSLCGTSGSVARTSSSSSASLNNNLADPIALFAFGAATGPSAASSPSSSNGGIFELARPQGDAASSSSSSTAGVTDQHAITEANVEAALRRYGGAVKTIFANPNGAKGRSFASLVNVLAAKAREGMPFKAYSVVVIIVDEDIANDSDVKLLNDALVEADDAPLSLIFVGVNQKSNYARFSAYEVSPSGQPEDLYQSSAASGGGGGGGGSNSNNNSSNRLRSNSGVGMGTTNPDEEAELYAACLGGISSAPLAVGGRGDASPLRHTVNGRRSRRNIAEFLRFHPWMAQLSRHDIAAAILEGVPVHFVEFSALHEQSKSEKKS